jgi:sec-independent protein translocase protein TatA
MSSTKGLVMPSIGPMEIAIVLIIALIILGPKRLPDAGRSLGRGMREFKDSISGSREEDEAVALPTTTTTAPAEAAGPARQAA